MKSRIIPHYIAFASAIVPGAALVITLLMSIYSGHIPGCVPNLEGCTSISRAARNGNALYVFRLMMAPAAMLHVLFWILLADWFGEEPEVSATSKRILVLGIIAEMFLLLYANFLGTQGEAYKFLRHSGIYVYFANTVAAEFLLTLNLSRVKDCGPVQLRLYRQMLGVSALIVIFALAQGFIKLFVAEHERLENLIEWNIAVAMHLPFLIFFSAWRATGFGLQALPSTPISYPRY